jgi:tRNA G10  N-methylase Trm11
MEYFFVPGRLKTLSFVELDTVCKSILGYNFKLTDRGEYILLETNVAESFVENIFPKLGGFLKFGVVLDENLDVLKIVQGEKVVFGISSYSSKNSFKAIKSISQEFKDYFVSAGKKVRFVLPTKETFLSSSQVISNSLISKGFELVLLDQKMGKTLAVQDIESFSLRDYSKPFVDKQMGVLPIKLARMMINFANIKQGTTLWDPFCGTGNILLEGLDLKYDVLGSDIDANSLEGAKKNILWAKKNFNYKNNSNIFFLDILNPSRSKLEIVKNTKLGGIVCEPYMGKAQKKILETENAKSLISQHLSLVQHLFMTLEFLNLSEKIRLVVVFPEYKTKNGWLSVEKKLLTFKNAKLLKLSEEDLHWSRVNSIIKRLIFVFEYIPK